MPPPPAGIGVTQQGGARVRLRERDNGALSRLRYYQEKFDLARARPFQGESSEFEVPSRDGTRISGTRLAGSHSPGSVAIVLAHGLLANRRLPALIALAESLSRFGPLWSLDLRGHGSSGGACTLGEAEAFDIAAVTALARTETDLSIVTIGFSMGAAAVVRSAALLEVPDAVVSVSGPADWRGRRGWGARKTALVWQVPGGIAMVRRLTGVRLSRQLPTGPSPLAAIAGISPVPVLIVHGTDDPFFPPGEAKALFDRAGEPKALWIVPGGGHAEGLYSMPGLPIRTERVDRFAEELMRRLLKLLPAEASGGESAEPILADPEP